MPQEGTTLPDICGSQRETQSRYRKIIQQKPKQKTKRLLGLL